MQRFIFAIILFLCSIVPPAHAIQTSIMTIPVPQFFDNQGFPLSGGKIYTCLPGTTCGPGSITLKSTYSTSAATVSNANPIVLDSAGRAPIWLNGYYKVAAYTATGTLLWTQDNVSSASASNESSVFLDAIGAPITYNISTRTDIKICKTDSTAHLVTITDSTPRVVPIDPLYVQGECVHLVLNDSIWYVE